MACRAQRILKFIILTEEEMMSEVKQFTRDYVIYKQ